MAASLTMEDTALATQEAASRLLLAVGFSGFRGRWIVGRSSEMS